MRRKGIIEMMIGVVIFLIFFIFYITTQLTNSSALKRSVAENGLLLAGSKVETYARSFLDALRLSLLQATYDAGMSYADKSWQCYGSSCLGGACSPDRVRGDIVNGDSAIGLNGSTGYANYTYLQAYRGFAKGNEPNMVLPGNLGASVSGIFDSNYIYARWPDATFGYCDQRTSDGKACAPGSQVAIDRTFTPEANLSTVFGRMYGLASDIISGDWLKQQVVMPAINGKSSDPKVCPSSRSGSYVCGFVGGFTVQCSYSGSPISCSGDSCRSSGYYEKCGAAPSADDVHGAACSQSTGQTRDAIAYSNPSQIDSKLASLGQQVNDRYNGVLSVRLLAADKQASIGTSCTAPEDTGRCCEITCGKSACYCSKNVISRSCTFGYSAAVRANVSIDETAYPKYALYNYTSGQVVMDSLGLGFVATSGNGNLIGCSVWTR